MRQVSDNGLAPLLDFVADGSCTVREALEVQYAKLAEANAKKDLKAILELRAPNFYDH